MDPHGIYNPANTTGHQLCINHPVLCRVSLCQVQEKVVIRWKAQSGQQSQYSMGHLPQHWLVVDKNPSEKH